MPKPFRFLAHRIFQEQVKAFLNRNSRYWGSLVDQCRKACADPFKAGKPLERVARKSLRGRIYRLWVGGRNRYRFIYVVDGQRKAVLGVFISSEVRANLDYDKVPWEEYADQIYEDYLSSNEGRFQVWTLPD